MATKIVTKSGSGAPATTDLVAGELAVDLTNKRLYTENGSAAIIELGTNPSGDVTFGDNGKAIFGAGSDLQIYHDGNHSYIEDAGTGSIKIKVGDFRVENASGNNLIKGVGDVATLHHAGAEKLATTASGIDVTGSVTADGLTASSVGGTVRVRDTAITDTTQDTLVMFAPALNTFALGVSSLTGFKKGIALTGGNDVSFYNTAGTSQALFWDASAESLGIGTTDLGSAALSVQNSAYVSDFSEVIITVGGLVADDAVGAKSSIGFGYTSAARPISPAAIGYETKSTSGGTYGDLLFATRSVDTNTAPIERLRIDNLGNVGIGVVPEAWQSSYDVLQIGSGGSLAASTTNESRVFLQANTYINASNVTSYLSTDEASQYWQNGGTHIFNVAPSGTADAAVTWTTAMTIDNSGNLLVGTTDTAPYDNSANSTADNGIVAGAGLFAAARYQGSVGLFNRTGNDGEILGFKRSGAAVGSIGVAASNRLYIGSGDAGLRFAADSNLITPWNPSTNSNSDNLLDLGNSANRWKNVYVGTAVLVGGTSTNPTGQNVAGAAIDASGEGNFSVAGAEALRLNRKTNDGDVLKVMKDGATIGAIGTHLQDGQSNFFIALNNASSDVGLGFGVAAGTGRAYFPTRDDGSGVSDAISIGTSTYKYKDLYLSGTANINTGISLGSAAALALTFESTTGNYATWKHGGSEVGDIGTGNHAVSGGTATDFGMACRTGSLVFASGGTTERARLDATGNLLVGKSLASTSGAGVYVEGSGIDYGRINFTSELTSATPLAFYYDNGTTSTQIGTISQSATATAYNTSSDQRLKSSIADADDAGSKIDSIQVRKFDWKADGSHQDYGMVAQELLEVAPEAVSAPEDPEEMMGVDYSKLVPMMLKEIQSLRARIAALES